MEEILNDTIKRLCEKPKGILAADESESSIAKKFLPLEINNTDINRNKYREMLFTSSGIERFISGVILHEETFFQKIKGVGCVEFLNSKQIVPGIKVDQGLQDFGDGEQITKDVDDLNEKLEMFFKAGARFAKWRTVYNISDKTPSAEIMEKNAISQAVYAKLCLQNGIVPIVEPEVLASGDHGSKECSITTARVLKSVFEELKKQGIDCSKVILKPNMIVPGLKSKEVVNSQKVAELTTACLMENVPQEVPAIVFLSGGQSEVEATQNLLNISKLNGASWRITFSYGRALQDSAINEWCGVDANILKGQEAFLERAKQNSLASVA